MKILYVDLDGTCFHFERHESLDPLFQKDYFKRLKPFDKVIEGIHEFQKKHPEISIKILSCCLDAPHIIPDKNYLMDKYMPFIQSENRIFIPYGTNKSKYMEKGNYLLDDYTQNLNEAQKNGCVGIKLINDINWNTRSWKGDIIHYDYPSWLIAEILEKIIEGEK